ncbi:MAG: glycosyltransferase family 4 protein [Planctomycetes bacterium]|nr:glycosyltransferase family 4 protein [Planctomycetota bacterium]
MHIAIVRTVFDKAHGGAERYAVQLARTWLAQGHQITVVCQRHAQADAEGMNVVGVSRPKVLGPFKHRWFARRAGQVAQETGADAVLCLARAFPGDVLRLGDGLHRAWLGARYPDLAQRRRALLNPRQQQLMKLERECFLPGRFGLYVANSEMVKRAVVHMYGVDPSRVRVIPNGVDDRFRVLDGATRAAFRSRSGLPVDAPVMLFSGMDFRRKGLMEAVNGFVAVGRKNTAARFVCVGRGDTSAAQSVLAQTGLADRAQFHAASSEMEQWYNAADVFVLPTMHDPSANAVTESLACGTPVITSSENGARQHIVSGVNGAVLRDRTDGLEIASSFLELAHARLSRSAVRDGSGLISADENAARTLAALHDAIKPQAGAEGLAGQPAAASRTQALRALKQQMWAQGDGRDYREVFREQQRNA